MNIGIFYGSSTGNTETAAEMIQNALGDHVSQMAAVTEVSPQDLLKFDVLIFGVPTWDIGQLQIDWEYFLPKMEGLDLTQKKIALFGMGDSAVYSLNFLDALGLVWAEVKKMGKPGLIGVWSTDGYEYDESLAKYDDDHFLGLGLDEENQAELHDERVTKWVAQIKGELGLS